MGLPRGRLQAGLVPRPRAGAGRGHGRVLRGHAARARAARERDAQAVRAAEAGDVPQDQEAARRRGLRPGRGDRLRDRAARRGTRTRTRSTGGATRSSATSRWRSCSTCRASTDEEIEKRKQKYADDDDFDDDPRKYFQWLAQRRASQAIAPPKRIIDLEKESTVLFIKALETIGDSVRHLRLQRVRARQRRVLRDQGPGRDVRRQGEEAHRQDRADPLDADGAGDPARACTSWTRTTRR